MAAKLTFLFSPIMDAVGHTNACIGLAQPLLQRGHEVIFTTTNDAKGKFEALGFKEEYFQDPECDEQTTDEWSQEKMPELRKYLAMEPIAKIGPIAFSIYSKIMEAVKDFSPRMKEIVEKVKPDLIIVDDVVQNPGLVDQGVPWVLSMSLNPLGISAENVPPPFLGEPIMNGNRKLWKKQEEKTEEILKDLFEDMRKWESENGGPEFKDFTFPFWHKHSPYANIYMYPEELDYTMFRPVPLDWHRFDAFARIEAGTFEIPQQLQSLPGKLIYFSMGTIGCCELELMQRLIAILAKSPHKFIVSKGPMADKLVLSANMWGAARIPQTLVLPLVDLVITHGGNNTITESFYFGKRVLVLPLFCDQLDNGIRIEETGLGLQFQPYHVTEQELLSGIETLLGDELLERRMRSISKRIQNSNSQERAADLLENVAKNNSKRQ